MLKVDGLQGFFVDTLYVLFDGIAELTNAIVQLRASF